MSTYKLIAVYALPTDIIAFDAHFNGTHLPLVRNIPALERVVVNRGIAPPWGGEPAAHQLVEMHFANEQSFKSAMASVENAAAGRDLRAFAKGLVTLHVVHEVCNEAI
jgi:uncharacterized protein (TIGR02118 family)